MMSQYDLPEDLIEDVFRRLPHNCLVRFKCLSKTWTRRISEFNSKSRNLLFFGFDRFFQSIKGDESVYEEIPTPWEDKSFPFDVVGSSNGMMLVVVDRGGYVPNRYVNITHFYLWNPVTKYYKQHLTLKLSDDVLQNYAFCYDPCTDDYKVVVGLDRLPSDDYGGNVIVGSTRTKCWKEIDAPFFVGNVEMGPLVEGCLHGAVHPNKRDECGLNFVIMCFDPTVDEFKEIPTPKSTKLGDGNYIYNLGVVDENLCMKIEGKNNFCEVMMMKEYGVVESWTTLYATDDIYGHVWYWDLVPLCSFAKGVKVVLILGNLEEVVLVTCDPKCSSNDKDVNENEMLSRIHRSLAVVIRYEQNLISPTYGLEDVASENGEMQCSYQVGGYITSEMFTF